MLNKIFCDNSDSFYEINKLLHCEASYYKQRKVKRQSILYYGGKFVQHLVRFGTTTLLIPIATPSLLDARVFCCVNEEANILIYTKSKFIIPANSNITLFKFFTSTDIGYLFAILD